MRFSFFALSWVFISVTAHAEYSCPNGNCGGSYYYYQGGSCANGSCRPGSNSCANGSCAPQYADPAGGTYVNRGGTLYYYPPQANAQIRGGGGPSFQESTYPTAPNYAYPSAPPSHNAPDTYSPGTGQTIRPSAPPEAPPSVRPAGEAPGTLRTDDRYALYLKRFNESTVPTESELAKAFPHNVSSNTSDSLLHLDCFNTQGDRQNATLMLKPQQSVGVTRTEMQFYVGDHLKAEQTNASGKGAYTGDFKTRTKQGTGATGMIAWEGYSNPIFEIRVHKGANGVAPKAAFRASFYIAGRWVSWHCASEAPAEEVKPIPSPVPTDDGASELPKDTKVKVLSGGRTGEPLVLEANGKKYTFKVHAYDNTGKYQVYQGESWGKATAKFDVTLDGTNGTLTPVSKKLPAAPPPKEKVEPRTSNLQELNTLAESLVSMRNPLGAADSAKADQLKRLIISQAAARGIQLSPKFAIQNQLNASGTQSVLHGNLMMLQDDRENPTRFYFLDRKTGDIHTAAKENVTFLGFDNENQRLVLIDGNRLMVDGKDVGALPAFVDNKSLRNEIQSQIASVGGFTFRRSLSKVEIAAGFDPWAGYAFELNGKHLTLYQAHNRFK